MDRSEEAGNALAEVCDGSHKMKQFDESSLKGKVGNWMNANHAWLELTLIVLVLADVLLLSTEAMIDNHWACVNGHVIHGASPKDISSSTALKAGNVDDEVHMLRKRRDSQKFLRYEDDEHQALSTRLLQEQGFSNDRKPDEHDGGQGHHALEETLACDTKNGHTAHHIAHTCHIASIAIL